METEAHLTATERRLIDEVVSLLLDELPPLDQDLIESGVDSMKLVHILFQAEELFGVELSAVDILDDVSISRLAALIDEKLGSAAT